MVEAPLAPLDAAVLPSGVRARFVEPVNGLRMHVLEAGFEAAERPLVLLLHGFPELAFSWRKVMRPLAEAGYHVVAPDQRGYGRTTGCDTSYEADLGPFRILNMVRDMLWLVAALGHRSVAAMVGHDYGASVAGSCALARPDVFRSLVLMSAPFGGAPSLPLGAAGTPIPPPAIDPIHRALAALPRPRKHYHLYYATRQANADMWHCPQGVHAFLRAYYHHKSADWPGDQPFSLRSWTADEVAKMPTYYVMDLHEDMASTAAAAMPSEAEVAACGWLTDRELAVYAAEYERTGFQGGLQWYRCRMDGSFTGNLTLFSGRTIDVPSMFVAGRADWGAHQQPGGLKRMRAACTLMANCHIIEGAGHWVQQERSKDTARLLLSFLAGRVHT